MDLLVRMRDRKIARISARILCRLCSVKGIDRMFEENRLMISPADTKEILKFRQFCVVDRRRLEAKHAQLTGYRFPFKQQSGLVGQDELSGRETASQFAKPRLDS